MKDSFNKPNDVMLSAYFSELLDDTESGNELVLGGTSPSHDKHIHSVELEYPPKSPMFSEVQHAKRIALHERKFQPVIEDVIEERNFSSIAKLLTQVEPAYQPISEEPLADPQPIAVQVESLPIQVETPSTQEKTSVDGALDVLVTSRISPDVILADEIEMKAEEAQQPKFAWSNIDSEDVFQVLFFEAFGVIYAVPLSQLGGIHHFQHQNKLFGRPDWHLGLQTENKKKFNVVDTARWVMPDKISENAEFEDYSYLIILGDSSWALSCNHLLGTSLIYKENVKWRTHAGKRPWLAGLVKDKMCALIHVDALIAMLNHGYDANHLPDTEGTRH